MATMTPTSNANSGGPRGLEGRGTNQIITGMHVQHFRAPGSAVFTEFAFTNFSVPITAALGYAGQLIYTFPQGRILPIMTEAYLSFVNPDVTTIEASSVTSVGFGTATASSATLATTMQDFMPGTGIAVATFTSSASNGLAVVFQGRKTSAMITIDGGTTALGLYFNVGVPTVPGADVDADGAWTVTGFFNILWCNMGGYAYRSPPTP